MPIADEWSELADLLANLIEKYATDLGLDDMPAPAVKKDAGIFESGVEPGTRV